LSCFNTYACHPERIAHAERQGYKGTEESAREMRAHAREIRAQREGEREGESEGGGSRETGRKERVRCAECYRGAIARFRVSALGLDCKLGFGFRL
jgi:hypothetical protein